MTNKVKFNKNNYDYNMNTRQFKSNKSTKRVATKTQKKMILEKYQVQGNIFTDNINIGKFTNKKVKIITGIQ